MDVANPRGKLLRAVALTGLGRYEDASADLRQLLREQPRFGEANFQLGLVLIAQKQFDKAEDLLKRVRVANPSDSRPDDSARGVVRLSGTI